MKSFIFLKWKYRIGPCQKGATQGPSDSHLLYVQLKWCFNLNLYLNFVLGVTGILKHSFISHQRTLGKRVTDSCLDLEPQHLSGLRAGDPRGCFCLISSYFHFIVFIATTWMLRINAGLTESLLKRMQARYFLPYLFLFSLISGLPSLLTTVSDQMSPHPRKRSFPHLAEIGRGIRNWPL